MNGVGEKDGLFLLRAVEVAFQGVKDGGGPFGAVITRNDEIIAESANRVIQKIDPTAHAEILAIREAASWLGTHDLSECTLYASCEPCPMCLGAIYWAGIKRVVFSSDRNEAEAAGFKDSQIYDEISLPVSSRKIIFRQLKIPQGKDVFRAWAESENKIQY